MPNQKLPCELLLILFSYVPIPDDLVSVQRVCSGWRATAQHKSLWKNFTLILSGTLHDKKNIIIMPAVRNVAGEADSDFLYQILENVKKLCKLNVNFDPPLTFPQLMAVLRKHPGLESISLSLGAPDLWMCLKVLRTSKHLIEVNFYVHDSYQYSYTIDRILLQLFAIFTDSKNFPALRKTNLVDPPLYYNRGLVTPALSTFISEKSKQLLSVKMAVFYDLDMTNTVSKCTNLQELDLAIYMSNSADIFIDKMAELKSLSLRFDSLKYRDNFSKLQDYFHRGSWAYLTKVSFIGHVYKKRMEGGVLNAIIKNVKQLKDLHYSDGERNTNESELCEVGNLSKLANLSLSGLYSISKASMSCIANCSKLRSLKLEVYTHDDVIQDICYTLRQLVNLEEIFISVSKNPSLIHLTDKEEVKRFTSSYKPTSLT